MFGIMDHEAACGAEVWRMISGVLYLVDPGGDGSSLESVVPSVTTNTLRHRKWMKMAFIYKNLWKNTVFKHGHFATSVASSGFDFSKNSQSPQESSAKISEAA